jgi:hypothetical protein
MNGNAVKGEWSDLLQTHQRDIVSASLFALGEKFVVDLSCAEHKSLKK